METESKTQDYNGCPDTCIKKEYYIFYQYDKGVGTILQGVHSCQDISYSLTGKITTFSVTEV